VFNERDSHPAMKSHSILIPFRDQLSGGISLQPCNFRGEKIAILLSNYFGMFQNKALFHSILLTAPVSARACRLEWTK
jgi:hypothetical protein